MTIQTLDGKTERFTAEQIGSSVDDLGSGRYQITLFMDSPETQQRTIIRSVFDFKRDPWPRESDTAKNLVRKMREPDPQKVLQKLEHSWIQNANKAPNVSLAKTMNELCKRALG